MSIGTLLSALSLAASVFVAEGDDGDKAVERYKSATEAKESALVALEQTYTRMESAWTGWRAAESSREPKLSAFLASRTAELLAQLDQRRAAAASGSAKEQRDQRHAEVDETTALLRTALTERELADPGLRGALADVLAKELVARIGKPAEVEARLATALEAWLGAKQRFEQLWNETLFQHCDEAKTYRDRYDDYLAAGVELDRAHHPESYLPGGAKTRPGMVYVAGGSYQVGPDVGFPRKKKRVTVRPFLIDRCEVSNADYVTFLEALPPEQRTAHTPRHWKTGPDGKAAPPADKLDHPIVGVTWRDADAYAKFANKRLPTEDEWEIAARGKEAWAYPWGDVYVAGRCNDEKLNLGTTVAVTRFEESASPFKALNMAGNVAEWTCSLEEGETFTDLPSNIAAVVVRGGYYGSPPEYVGGLIRWVAPGGSSREDYLGFRCVADLK
jgi:formylglycine-generating enzyme required for sulfatase activity